MNATFDHSAALNVDFAFQNMFIPMTITTAEGSINAIPEQIVFEEVYPVSFQRKPINTLLTLL